MTRGIGGSDAATELAQLQDMSAGAEPIGDAEFAARLQRAQQLMQAAGLDALYLNAGTNLLYFTGTRWSPSERMVGALIPAQGEPRYIAPAFELGTLQGFLRVAGEVHCWEEHESPYRLCAQLLKDMHVTTLGVDESAPFFIVDGLQQAAPQCRVQSATPITAGCRMQKSAAELALMQRAKDMTLEVHRAVARILRPGITTGEVTAFIHEAHKRVGAPAGSYFCIVLFGPDSAFPHGVAQPKALDEGDMVLIDTGCQLHGYISDITRSYVLGEPSAQQREIWNLEKAAQQAAFEAAQIGASCGSVDDAARAVLAAGGLSPDYQLPGLPHRTGHGIGLDIHEWPYLVRDNSTPLAPGMCFSNEPMICVPGAFGVRLEDHFYMTENGPRWFTQPARSVDDPFGS
ncbi:Xaa-Pro peptidase family protein [Haliea sp.]|jgi:Xaa-Pro dipeptidase|uniref:M24 family metallopeptidase n=1 Tax=Haliea TaxID=475794 RepID=UPI000C35DF93|nr:Xaa-Pro peptidase family protein [Haliea sp.]MAY92709.1 X-Pro dipeptidase [Haliea sp.]MBP70088.1 X-Pro dipeptidase [Haliea sp.]HBM83912.1 X-Pro dipeptidase [Halieaceae bacterium]|tara:strand:+ start:921 stop:2126 length:1206 start_codon:yes stop_codon:yes gene_type:complete